MARELRQVTRRQWRDLYRSAGDMGVLKLHFLPFVVDNANCKVLSYRYKRLYISLQMGDLWVMRGLRVDYVVDYGILQ